MTTPSDRDRPEPAPILVNAFLDASRDALNFLAAEPGFRSAVTVEQARNEGIVAVNPDAVSGLFWVRRSFSTNRLTGVMTYGERELEVNLLVDLIPAPRGASGPYGLWEWQAALGVRTVHEAESSPSWCATGARVRAAVGALGVALLESAPRIVAAGPEVIQKLEAARAARRAAEADVHAQWQHATAVGRAAAAFRAGDYARVVSLLAPLEARLTPAEQKKLALARKRV